MAPYTSTSFNLPEFVIKLILACNANFKKYISAKLYFRTDKKDDPHSMTYRNENNHLHSSSMSQGEDMNSHVGLRREAKLRAPASINLVNVFILFLLTRIQEDTVTFTRRCSAK